MDDNQEINENINSEEDNNIITRSFDPPPTPAERLAWINHILNTMKTTQYKVWYLKSHDKNAYPFDTCRGFLYWDFDQELLFFVEPNKDTYTSTKYPIVISTIGFDDILNIEAYYNMRDETANP